MRFLVLGADGYIGWPLTQFLQSHGHIVYGIDNFTRRQVGRTAIPVLPPNERGQHMEKFWHVCIVEEYQKLKLAIKESKPDCIVHLAEQPSAPWSMRSRTHCLMTHQNNLAGTINLLYATHEVCPEAHIIKLGSMGEYGTRNTYIPEGEFEFFYPNGELVEGEEALARGSGFFPRHPGSWYHLTKVHDTHNCEFASRMWGLRITDIMQGVVFGLDWNPLVLDKFLTRFDYDECFGTVINRFCAQAVSNNPLTIYGSGGQTRGYIPLRDSLRCINLIADNPPSSTTPYRTFNQLAKVYSVRDLANAVSEVTGCKSSTIEAPRLEELEHEYYPITDGLANLGYHPSMNLLTDIEHIIKRLTPYRKNINPAHFMPEVKWRNE